MLQLLVVLTMSQDTDRRCPQGHLITAASRRNDMVAQAAQSPRESENLFIPRHSHSDTDTQSLIPAPTLPALSVQCQPFQH